MNRHLWRHHYFGTQGVIILISNNDLNYGDKLIMVSQFNSLLKCRNYLMFTKIKIYKQFLIY